MVYNNKPAASPSEQKPIPNPASGSVNPEGQLFPGENELDDKTQLGGYYNLPRSEPLMALLEKQWMQTDRDTRKAPSWSSLDTPSPNAFPSMAGACPLSILSGYQNGFAEIAS